jgi:phage gp36-like protein
VETDKQELIGARQLINRLTLICRQTVTFLSGHSAMDERRVKRALQDAINQSNRFMNVEE